MEETNEGLLIDGFPISGIRTISCRKKLLLFAFVRFSVPVFQATEEEVFVNGARRTVPSKKLRARGLRRSHGVVFELFDTLLDPIGCSQRIRSRQLLSTSISSSSLGSVSNPKPLFCRLLPEKVPADAQKNNCADC